MKLNIDTTHKKVYRQVVEIMRSFPPLNTLRKRELDVLAVLMYYNYKYRSIEEGIRWRVIGDTSTRKDMQTDVIMNEDTFNNNISILRRTGLVDKEGRIPKFLQIIIEDKYELTFNFKIKEND